jgi:nicotinamidase-related amidase
VGAVISILNHRKQVEQPVLILVGLHESDHSAIAPDRLQNALANCEAVLNLARSARIPVAFVRCIAPSEPRAYPAWLKGFEPTRDDMIFDVTQASCYSNTEFAQAMEYSRGNFAIAGLFGETTCLSTAIDAHHRRHSFTYLSDASICRNNGAIPAAMFHDAVSQVMSIYGEVMEGSRWSRLLSCNRISQ